MSSIVRREELTLLRKRYLPRVYRAYERMMRRLDKIDRKIDDAEGGIVLTEEQQRKLLREIYRDYRALGQARNVLGAYLRDIFTRLEMDAPS